MPDVLAITGPIYLTILVGYLAVRSGAFSPNAVSALGTLTVDFALPAMIFGSLAERRIGEVLSVTYLAGYAVASMVLGALVFLLARHAGKRDASASACYAMGSVSSNSAFIGFPVLLVAVPTVAGTALAINIIVENLMVMPLFLLLAEGGRDSTAGGLVLVGRSVRRVLSRPLIIALLAGVVVSLLELDIPPVVTRTVDLIGRASGFLSLFFVGGTLACIHLGRLLREVSGLAVVKLVLHPLAVWLTLTALSMTGLGTLEPEMRLAAVLMAAMPVMSMYPVIAQRFGQQDVAATALLSTTAGSFLTLNLLLWWFAGHPS
jgi:predicted permease